MKKCCLIYKNDASLIQSKKKLSISEVVHQLVDCLSLYPLKSIQNQFYNIDESLKYQEATYNNTIPILRELRDFTIHSEDDHSLIEFICTVIRDYKQSLHAFTIDTGLADSTCCYLDLTSADSNSILEISQELNVPIEYLIRDLIRRNLHIAPAFLSENFFSGIYWNLRKFYRLSLFRDITQLLQYAQLEYYVAASNVVPLQGMDILTELESYMKDTFCRDNVTGQLKKEEIYDI